LDVLANIILQARCLSYTIQQDIVSCRLFITLPVLTDEDTLANYALIGLVTAYARILQFSTYYFGIY
jgi:hypothetical protein